MTVSDEIALSMTAIMTTFARGENRSMLNQPFLNGKARMAASRAARRDGGGARRNEGERAAVCGVGRDVPARAT
ncbi:hypothetical protein [Burkholderia sp. AW49-1]